jgi:hypothetical protein
MARIPWRTLPARTADETEGARVGLPHLRAYSASANLLRLQRTRPFPRDYLDR